MLHYQLNLINNLLHNRPMIWRTAKIILHINRLASKSNSVNFKQKLLKLTQILIVQ